MRILSDRELLKDFLKENLTSKRLTRIADDLGVAHGFNVNETLTNLMRSGKLDVEFIKISYDTED